MKNLIGSVRDTARLEIMPQFRNAEPDARSTKLDAKLSRAAINGPIGATGMTGFGMIGSGLAVLGAHKSRAERTSRQNDRVNCLSVGEDAWDL